MGIPIPPLMPLPNSPPEHWEKYFKAMRRYANHGRLQIRLLAIATGLSIGVGLAILAMLHS